jgi:HAD superfamily hydrolase (TIGR01509 family)
MLRKRLARPQAAIFDLDGTLRDTLQARFVFMTEVSHRLNCKVLTWGEVRDLMRSTNPPWDYIIPLEREGERDRIIEDFEQLTTELWPRIYAQEVRPIPQAQETLERLHQDGVKLGIVTHSFAWELSMHEWERRMYGLVGEIITRREVPNFKPAPDPVLECLRRLKAPAEKSICVGDSPVDIKAGKAAGTLTIGVLTGVSDYETLKREEPDLILPSVGELAWL